MQAEQEINCTVTSCRFNENSNQKCGLKQIMVTPKQNCNTCNADESMCASYENIEDKKF